MSPQVPASIPQGPYKLSMDEYRELPNDGRRYQILDGRLDVIPAATPRHQRISRKLQQILMEMLEDRGAGEVYQAPIDVVLDPHSIVQPDLLFIATNRLHIVGDQNIQGAPDLVIEILSPSTRRTDVLVKSELYARFGVPQYWIVDPDLDRIDAYLLQEGRYERVAYGASPEALQVPGLQLQIPLERVFGRTPKTR